MIQTNLNGNKINDLELKKILNKQKNNHLSKVKESFMTIKITSRINNFQDYEKENITDEVHKDFHINLMKYIEGLITENDEFDFDFLTYGWEDKPEDVNDFNDLGQIGIQIKREVINK